ncbi:UNVERIFIED_ORG: hypothetical protein ABIB19_003973, partial [Arthrobacter sp. UYEF10]
MDALDDAPKIQTRRPSRLVALLLVQFAVSAMLVTCGGPACTGNTREYNGQCLGGVAITYIECTKGRGFDLTTKLGGKLGGTFKVVGLRPAEWWSLPRHRAGQFSDYAAVSSGSKIAS